MPSMGMGVNPRGLGSCEVWQTDITHIPSFGCLKYVHVSIDTHSDAVYASAHAGEKTEHAKKHLVQAFSVLGIPKEIKTDNGPAYASKEFLEFVQQWGVEHKTGNPHSSTEKAYLTLNPVMNPIQVVILLLLNSLAAAWIIPQPRQNVWVTLAQTLQQENICLSTASTDNPMSTCLTSTRTPENTPAAKKMVYLAPGCYPVGEGKGRGVHRWGILMVLSLAMCQAGGLHPKDPLRQNPTNECEQCLKGKIATKVIKYQAQYNCQPVMQIAALPTDPELAVGKTGQIPKMSRIMKLEEKKEANNAAEALEKFERKIKKENAVHQKYCEISQEEWDDYSKFEDNLSSL
ncbi:hypothetical protein DUI87_01298 [Hirundo rustica rustica]|uniref:Integrase catalytic domain-containing protein n=1 Tax=Hirundo rustica rustica TaxID=333673 RepID=A0A3M0L4V7_HIRRU|nr:hypothetical protein DUI87_01298 [Hirundo rustica rustica]